MIALITDVIVAQLSQGGVAVWTNDGDILNDAGIKWKDVVVVLEQDNGLLGGLESKLLMSWCVHILGAQ